MNKLIVLVLALFISASFQDGNVTDADAIAFLEGFGPAVGQPNATDILVNCTQTEGGDALDALKATIEDLKQKDIHGAYQNFMSFIQAVNVMRATCPAGAEPFYDEFEPAYEAFNQSKTDFLESIDRDISRDPSGALQATIGLGLALDGQDYYNAGASFGDLTVIALAAYLNNTPVVEHETPRFVFDVEISDDESSSSSSSSSSEGSATEFFEGFASAFGLQQAAKEIMVCVENDPEGLIQDIQNLINDISNSNWSAVVTDLVDIYDEIDNMASDCPDGANPFINEFEPVVEELSSDSSEFWDTVGDNVKNNLGTLLGDVGNIIVEINNNQWEQAGADFGNIFFTTLSGILPNSQNHKMTNVFEVLKAEDKDEDSSSSSEGSATEFFEGFAAAFGLQQAAKEIMICVQNDPEGLIQDIQNLINDITKSDWSAVVTDLVDIYDDIDNMVSDCPDGANPFINEFEPVVEELSSDSSEFWHTVGDNVKDNLGTLLGDIGNIIVEINDNQWEQAGNDFGNIFFTTLKGILPNSENHKMTNVFEVLNAQDQNEDSSSSSSSEGSATEFFEGFASAFGLQQAAKEIMVCVENDPEGLIQDIQNLINDISNSNWSAVVTDLVDIYDEIDNMASDCPDGANPFINEFEPVVEELSSDSSEFWDTVGDNVKNNLGTLLGDVGNIIVEINNNQWEQAGADFGNIFFTTLSGILPNSDSNSSNE